MGVAQELDGSGNSQSKMNDMGYPHCRKPPDGHVFFQLRGHWMWIRIDVMDCYGLLWIVVPEIVERKGKRQ